MNNIKEYKSLTIPKITWNNDSLTGFYGELVAQPLESGFGITFGNALRRILLGGIEGSAVTSVIINGVNNEFSIIPDVVEDTMQLILNIKQIVVKSKDGKPGVMRLKVEGESVIKVSDINTDENLELVNKDHIIANVSVGGSLDITFFVESGRGYQPAAWPDDKKLQEDGRIFLDSMFSPVANVTFNIEKTRVGGAIDYDKLNLNITTNGSETPVDVLHYSISVLRTQLEHFLAQVEIPFNSISQKPVVEGSRVIIDKPIGLSIQGVSIDLLLKPIDELELSVRAHNCLMNAEIKRVIDLVNLSEDDGLKIKNFGRKSLNEVKDSMKIFGLSFDMNIKEEDVQNMMKDRGMSIYSND